MYSLFKKSDDGLSYDFVDYLHNNEEDKFLNILLSSLVLVQADVKLFKYDKVKFKEYITHQQCPDENCILEMVNDGINDGRISKKLFIQPRVVEDIYPTPADPNAIDYYTQVEIDAYALDSSSVQLIESAKFETQAEIINTLESIDGVEINIQAKIDAENA